MSEQPPIDTTTGSPQAGAPLGIVLGAQAAATPDAPAITFEGEVVCFRELEERANRRARQLLALGVVAGDTVIIALANRPEYFECTFALWKIGAVPCPVSNVLSADEFAAIVELAAPKLVVTDKERTLLKSSLLVDGPPPAELSASPLPPAVARPGKIVTSGGSTGRPKLIVDPLPSIWDWDKEVIGRSPRSVILNSSPLYHSGPFAISHFALAQGCNVVCMGKFDANAWLANVARYQVSFAYVVPTIMTRIAKLDPEISSAVDLSSLTTLLHTAAPCPPSTKSWWIERIGGPPVIEIYGGSERIGATMIAGDEWLVRPGSVGRAFPGQEIVILNEQGEPAPPGEIGEIWFRKLGEGPDRYSYIGAQTREARKLDGFGDMGWIDEEGYLFIADRRTDMITVGGANIYPAEIEAVIDSIPGVFGSAVIGLPDPDLGNRVHVIVEIADDDEAPDPTALLAGLRSRLTGFKVPRSVEFTTSRIRDDAGKVRRSALRDARLGKI